MIFISKYEEFYYLLLITGLAWVKAICYKVRYNQYYENSIVEDKGKAIVGLVAAHELGHK